jgi:excisionase family DNA binding protein
MRETRQVDLLRIPEAAERLNVSRASVYRWAHDGRLPCVQLGGQGSPLRIPADELEAWVFDESAGNATAAAAPPVEPRTERSAPVLPAVEAHAPAGTE